MEYNLAVVMGKKSPSSKKAENKKLQEVFAESQKLKDAVELSMSQWGILFGAGVLTATIPCGLMFTAVYSIPADILSKSIAYFGIGVGLTGLVMAMNYNVLSSKEKARLVFGLGADSAKQVQAAFVESSSFAIMLGNFSYFFMYAFFMFYVLPAYGFNDASNFFISSVGSSLTLFVGTRVVGDKVDMAKAVSSVM